jgi:hypothetical protein
MSRNKFPANEQNMQAVGYSKTGEEKLPEV